MNEAVEMKNIPVRLIHMTDRAREHYKDLDTLVKDIEEKGLIQPIAVMPSEDGFKLLAGGRRFSAMVLAKKETIPCRIYPATLSALEQKEIELMENVSRDDFDWKEEVALREAIQKLQEAKYGSSTTRETAKMLGTSAMTISRDLTLARGLATHPEELAKAKTKTEALRTLKKLTRQEEEARIVRRVDQADLDIAEAKRTLANAFHIQDFFEGVQDVKDGTIAFIEIDPPYAIALDKIKRGAENETSPGIESYNEIPAESYRNFLDQLFAQCYRTLAPGGWLVCWHAFQWTAPLVESMERAGLLPVAIPAFWHKVGHQGQTRNPDVRLGSVLEPFIYARKDASATLKQPGRTNCFSYRALSPDAKVHPTERPIELIEDVIRTFCPPGGRIMVPFLGSGNTLLAAANRSSPCFGYDLATAYRNAFVARVLSSAPGSYKSYKEAT